MFTEADSNELLEEHEAKVHRKIILAYDGSDHAATAVELLRRLNISTGSEIKVLAVLPTQHIGGHEILQNKLEVARSSLEASGATVAMELKAGNPAGVINEIAEREKSDLIVIGAKGLRATLGILLGGVAQQVVEYSSCPVLVVRAAHPDVKRALFVTDGSASSQHAISFIISGEEGKKRFPLSPDIEIHLTHVLPPPINAEMVARSWTVGPETLFPVTPQSIDTAEIEMREENEGRALLARTEAQVAAGGYKTISVLLRGDAATEIIEYAKEQAIDLIVAGSRGLNPISSWLLGSVSRKLVHYASCSVLIVKIPR